MNKLEVGKDYININDLSTIVIDRVGNFNNKGFNCIGYYNNLSCRNPANWREATEQEIIDAFKKRLVCLYGEDWRTMKIKKRHPDSTSVINDDSWIVDISKHLNGWSVWNENGALYGNGIWVERLEEVNIKAIEKLPIDKVTIKNLDIALRAVGIQLDINIIDKVIDLVELIENKGDDVTIKDIVSLQQTWS